MEYRSSALETSIASDALSYIASLFGMRRSESAILLVALWRHGAAGADQTRPGCRPPAESYLTHWSDCSGRGGCRTGCSIADTQSNRQVVRCRAKTVVMSKWIILRRFFADEPSCLRLSRRGVCLQCAWADGVILEHMGFWPKKLIAQHLKFLPLSNYLDKFSSGKSVPEPACRGCWLERGARMDKLNDPVCS